MTKRYKILKINRTQHSQLFRIETDENKHRPELADPLKVVDRFNLFLA